MQLDHVDYWLEHATYGQHLIVQTLFWITQGWTLQGFG